MLHRNKCMVIPFRRIHFQANIMLEHSSAVVDAGSRLTRQTNCDVEQSLNPYSSIKRTVSKRASVTINEKSNMARRPALMPDK